MRRRDFLTLAGGAVAGVTLGRVGLARVLPPRVDPSEPGPSGTARLIEREAVSVCGGCAAGCSVLLRIIDERIVGIRGNSRCPLGMGGLCPRGVSEVAAFYEPDRLLGPIAFGAQRGRDPRRISWKQGLDRVGRHVKGLVAKGAGARIGVILSSGRGVTSAVAQSVLASLGSPHVYRVDPLRDEAIRPAATLAFGEPLDFGYDLDRTDTIFAFGAPILEGWLSPTYVARRFGRGRLSRERLRLVYIGSHLSQTAMRADEWIRCRPGTEPLVALAVAGHMLREELVSATTLDSIAGLEPFTDRHGTKRDGLRRTLGYAYSPHAVAQQSAVPVVDIVRLARDFAASHAPVAIGERTAGSAGMFGLTAVQLLNAVADRIGRPGGVFRAEPAPLAALPGPKPPTGRLDRPPFARVAGTSIWRSLREIARLGKKPPFDLLVIEDGAALGDLHADDPAFGMLQRIPVVISAATGLDASTAVADLVLPATTSFEQVIDVEPAPSGPFAAVAAARAAVAPLVDGRPLADLLLALGRAAGKLPAAAPRDVAAAVHHRLKGLAAVRRGLPYDTPHKRTWTAQMESAGWWTARHDTETSFLEAVYDHGGWVDPVIEMIAPSTESKVAVHGLVHLGGRPAAEAPFPLPATEDVWLPRSEREASVQAPANALVLEPIPVGPLNGRGTPNRPALLQVAAPHVQAGFRPWAEFNPADARARGIGNTDILRLESPHGAVELEARVTEGVRPGTVAVPWAPWAMGGGRYLGAWTGAAERLAGGVSSAAIGARVGAGVPISVIRTGRNA